MCNCADGLFHDVGFVANDGEQCSTVTMPTPARCLWMRRLRKSHQGSENRWICFLINDHWGILSTPVIDSTTAIGWVGIVEPRLMERWANAQYTLHGIRLDSGSRWRHRRYRWIPQPISRQGVFPFNISIAVATQAALWSVDDHHQRGEDRFSSGAGSFVLESRIDKSRMGDCRRM